MKYQKLDGRNEIYDIWSQQVRRMLAMLVYNTLSCVDLVESSQTGDTYSRASFPQEVTQYAFSLPLAQSRRQESSVGTDV